MVVAPCDLASQVSMWPCLPRHSRIHFMSTNIGKRHVFSALSWTVFAILKW